MMDVRTFAGGSDSREIFENEDFEGFSETEDFCSCFVELFI